MRIFFISLFVCFLCYSFILFLYNRNNRQLICYCLLIGEDPDYARRDLFDSIENKRFPSWTLYIQVITLEEVHSDFTYNPFDATKVIMFYFVISNIEARIS